MQFPKKLGLKQKLLLGLLVVGIVWWWFSLPKQLFEYSFSCVVNDAQGNLLGARIADDGQWRFPKNDSVPSKFEQAILHFEDEYFYYHPGFNPVSMAKAFYDNTMNSTKRGGSTITQQVIRLSRKNQARSYSEKIIELVLSTRLEATLNKAEILRLYATYAPFGGNVVGLEAASWRYFGIPSSQLTWGQSAALAVLPNAPSIIYPGKNETAFRNKRDYLLKKLLDKQVIDNETYQLSLLEDLPSKPLPLPEDALHWVNYVCQCHPNQVTTSTVQANLQNQVSKIVNKHASSLQQNHIHNIAVLVVHNSTRKVHAYVGNASAAQTAFRFVDMVQAKRSTGSTLKPFLYAAALDKNQLLPHSLLRDMPVSFGGYRPQNFSQQFQGLVPAHEALSSSLNVPFVNLLQAYGLPIFYSDLQKAGLHQINKGEKHYGLSLILGGAEVSLWELTQAYANFKETYSTYVATSSQYATHPLKKIQIAENAVLETAELSYQPSLWRASSVYFTLQAMTSLQRPEDAQLANLWAAEQQIAWKTGTSYGFKDAWAIGVNEAYTVGVWVGNADGEGRPNLTGIKAAAPILFDVFEKLPQNSQWLLPPYDDVQPKLLCEFSGLPASDACSAFSVQYIPAHANPSSLCTFHQEIYVDETQTYQVQKDCYPASKIKKKKVVQLSPSEAYFTQSIHVEKSPPLHPDCIDFVTSVAMEFIYPRKGERIILPKNFDETQQEIVLQLAHHKPTEIHWYIDNTYLTTTFELHETSVYLPPATYQLSVVDEAGNRLEQMLVVEESK